MANEKRLIDGNVLSAKVAESKRNNPHPQGMIRVNHRNEHDHFLRMIDDAPTVDAVEVVRCKDCKHWGYVVGCGHYCECYANQMADTEADDFCSYGERREGE